MLPIMLSARQGWSTGTYKQKSRLTYQIFGASHVAIEVIWTYVVASSKNPVELQVLVWPDKTLAAFAGATVQRLPRQAQEGLDPIPSKINESPIEAFSLAVIIHPDSCYWFPMGGSKNWNLLELLNPCFCSDGRANYVKLRFEKI